MPTLPSATPAPPVLQARHLHFAHAGQPPLLSDWSVSLPSGITALQGDMGSGKTSVLRLLAGVWACNQGDLQVHSLHLADAPEAYRREVCWFEVRDEAFDALTPTELRATLARGHGAADEVAWLQHINGFGLTPHLHKPMFQLSTGSRQKAALAAALSLPCAVLLLDEPTTGLDAASIDWLEVALIERSTDPRRAVLLVCSRGLDALPLAGTIELAPPRA